MQLEKYPFVRFIIPLIAGIICGEIYPIGWAVFVSALAGACAFSLCFLYKSKFFFGIILFFFFFFLGNHCLLWQKKKTDVLWSGEKELYIATITDKPQEKPRSFLCLVKIDNHKVLLYIAKDSLSRDLHRGDRILLYACITKPEQKQIPGFFNYGRYLLRQGIVGTAYVGMGFWKQIKADTTVFSFKQIALNFRDHLLERYKELGFRGDELAVLSALTLGDKSELRENLKETYSVTGASHVLALSGLHMGILYGICVFIFSLIPIGRSACWIRMGCLVAVLWCFAFIVGLSASVVRSASMFSLFAVAQCLQRNGLSWNILAVSAFFMLLYQPYYIFDVGFQLSYVAVAFIIWLNPIVSGWWKPSNRILRYIWGILSVSLVAQLGVAPLIMYYFSRFSVYFLLTNLLVIPCTFCLVAGTLFMLFCGFCFPLQKGIAVILNEGIKWMHVGLSWIENIPYSVVDQINVDLYGIVCFYLFVFFLVGFCLRKRAKYLIGTLTSIVCMMVLYALSLFSVKPSSILFYHSVQGASVQCAYAGKEAFELLVSNNDAGIYRFCGKTIVLLKDNRWSDCYVDSPLLLDYLFIEKGFTGKMADLQDLFDVQHVVLDSSLNVWQQQRIQKECKELGINVFSLSEKGYLWVEM